MINCCNNMTSIIWQASYDYSVPQSPFHTPLTIILDMLN